MPSQAPQGSLGACSCCVPPGRLPPSQAGWHCLELLMAMGAISRSAQRPVQARSCRWLRARLHLRSHPGMCVVGLASGCSRSCLGRTAARTPPSPAPQSVQPPTPPWPLPRRQGRQAGSRASRQGMGGGNPGVMLPEDPAGSLPGGVCPQGAGTSLGSGCAGSAALAGPVGRRVPGSSLVLLDCPFAPGRNYNQSCGVDSPGSCCTLDHIPLVSKCGTLPPESCFFSLICSLGSFMVILVGLLRYAHLLERLGPSLLNTLGLATGWVCAAGLTMVGNFQVDHAKVLHYIGAGVAFPTSMLFLLLQSILTYRMAKTRGQYWTGHLRSILTTVAFLTLVFSGVFFIQESFVLQHVAALCEWVFIIDVLVFYGTFTFEFGAISTDTFLVLLKASRAPKSYKGENSVSSTVHIHSHAEGLAMA
ncbi:transmembrane protein 150A isoform 1-T1 [Alca torda]